MTQLFLMTLIIAASSLLMLLILTPKSGTLWMEWKIMETEFNSMNFALMMDWKSTMFVWTVTIISGSIIKYSNFYMPNCTKIPFTKMILSFVASMVLLIISPTMVSLIMGWEGLGMSSFLLIMFFMNKSSMMSSTYTMLINRLGDIMLMISMILMMNLNSWTLTCCLTPDSSALLLILMGSLFSKSAQIPFSSWLTEAMAAPTPVSALVHSSTLVTAGVYVMIRMEMSMKITNTNILVFIISMMTLIMASMNAILQLDIKKVIALSTLSQLSTMFIAISINMYKMAFFHMIMHATFKALIFLCSSSFISISNTQDVRKISTSLQTSMVTTCSFNMANLTLSGLMFTSGFYSKELIIEMMALTKTSYMWLMMFMAAMSTTAFYSTKVIILTTLNKSMNMTKLKTETNDQMISKLMISIPSIILGNKMNWVINLNSKISFSSMSEKFTPLMWLLMMMLIMPTLYFNLPVTPASTLTMSMNYMWFMKNFSTKLKMDIFNALTMIFKISEKGMLTTVAEATKLSISNAKNSTFSITHASFKLMITLTAMMATMAMY